jgi:hypothetical protein
VKSSVISVKSNSGRSGLRRRLEILESRLTDTSGLVPLSPAWLEYWDREIYNYVMGQRHASITLDGMRAIMHYADAPASLVGRTSDADDE